VIVFKAVSTGVSAGTWPPSHLFFHLITPFTIRQENISYSFGTFPPLFCPKGRKADKAAKNNATVWLNGFIQPGGGGRRDMRLEREVIQ
jgi:hypothetical protein